MLTALSLIFCAASAWAFEPEELIRSFTPARAPLAERAGFNALYNPFAKIQLAVKKDEFNADGYAFGLKLRPKGFFAGRDYHKLGTSLNQQIDLKEKTFRSESLVTAYTLLAKADYAKEQAVLLEQLKALAEKASRVSRLEAQRSRLDAKSLLKASLEIGKVQDEVAVEQASISEVRALLAEKNLRLENLNTADLMSPADIGSALASLTPPAETLTAANARSDSALADAALSLRRSENRRWLEEVEVFTKDGKNETRVGFEVTLNLPFLAAPDLDEQKDQLKATETRLESEQVLSAERVKLPRMIQFLKDKIAVYELLDAGGRTEEAAEKIAAYDPAFALELKRTSLQRKLNKAKLRAEIRTAYVGLLHEAGKISAEETRSLLSRSGRSL